MNRADQPGAAALRVSRAGSAQGMLRGLKLSPQLRRDITGYLFISPWIIGFLVFTAGTMLYSVGLSFFETNLLNYTEFTGTSNWTGMVKERLFWKSLMVTSMYTFGSVPPRLALALLIAILLNQKIRALGLFRTVYYLPSVVSGVAVAILWSWVLNPEYGLVNTGLGILGIEGPRWIFSETWAVPAFILMSLWGTGGSMLLFLAGLQGIPTPLYEAAKVDGAGVVRRFFHITLPMLSPTIFFNLVMSMIGSYQVFAQAYIMTGGGPNNATLTMVLYLYREGFTHFRFGYASAVAWALFLIIMFFTMFVIRSSAAWVHYEGELRR